MPSFPDAKHRDESELYEIDFTDRLTTAETISSVTTLKIRQKDSAGVWQDKSADFGSPTGSISGKKVQFTLGAAASATVQLRGDYVVYCEIVTSTTETVVEAPVLSVHDDASV